jgi:CheY-like chemotaxis protein
MRTSPHVLIVDDVPDNRELYVEYLRFRGFRVTEAASGTEALAALHEVAPDVVLLDMRLPDIEGAEVCRRMVAGPRKPVIIALSAGVARQDVDRALANGCAMFLTKPCLPETLETEIRRVLDMSASA